MARYNFTAARRAALKRASAKSAAKRSRGKKPYAKQWGSRNRNGKFATKRGQKINRAKTVGKVAVAAAYAGGYAYVSHKGKQQTAAYRARTR